MGSKSSAGIWAEMRVDRLAGQKKNSLSICNGVKTIFLYYPECEVKSLMLCADPPAGAGSG